MSVASVGYLPSREARALVFYHVTDGDKSSGELHARVARIWLQGSRSACSCFQKPLLGYLASVFCWKIKQKAIIDRFYVTSLLSKIQSFYPHRHKRLYIYICLQFYSSIACFVWKPKHFEFQSYGGAWHKATIAFVEKYLPISWFVAFSEVRALGKVLM